MTKQQPIATSSLLDIDYEEPQFNHAERSKKLLDPHGLTDHLTQKSVIQQDRSKVHSDMSPVPVAITLSTLSFDMF